MAIEQLVEQISVLLEATQLDKIAMCNLTTAKTALVNRNAGITNRLDQALVQISDMQTEIESLKHKREK